MNGGGGFIAEDSISSVQELPTYEKDIKGVIAADSNLLQVHKQLHNIHCVIRATGNSSVETERRPRHFDGPG